MKEGIKLMYEQFNQAVRVRSIILRGAIAVQAPKAIKAS